MRRPGVLLLAALLVLAGCADPSLEPEARSLADDVGSMPGVEDVRLDYGEPVTLDSGTLELTVAMADDATAAQVQDVGAAVYDAFREVHDGEEADLELTFGGSRVHVRSFRPEAATADVEDELALATSLGATSGGRGDVEVEVDTQDVARGDHVESTVLLHLGEGTAGDDVLRALDELEAEHGDDDGRRSWGVEAADGSSLTFDPGFPDVTARDGWEALVRAGDDLEGIATATVALREVENRDEPRYRFAEVSVVGAAGPLDLEDPILREQVLDLARDQVGLLSPSSQVWSYDLAVDGQAVASLDPQLCDPDVPSGLGEIDEALRSDETCPGPSPEPSGS